MGKKVRIIFTGAQGTGKTTILNHFKKEGADVITEVVRRLARENGVNINECGDEEGQRDIFNKYIELLSQDNSYISDRGLTDVISYTYYLKEQGKLSDEFVKEQEEALKKFVTENPDIIYCYFPIEFSVEDDGVRSTNEAFRTAVDRYILNTLTTLGVPYVKVTGTVDERIEIVSAAILVTVLNQCESQ
jgi:predicted ATPase